MTTNKMKKLLFLIPSIAMTGCMGVPTLTLKINPVTHEVALSNPKDTTIQGFSASVGTNGSSTVTFTSLSTVENPAVINSVGNANANAISATGTAATQLLNGLAAQAGTVGGAALLSK